MDLNIISWVAFGVIVAVIAFLGFRMFKQRLDQMRYQEQLAELEFQESLLADMNTGVLGDDSRFAQAEAIAMVTHDVVDEIKDKPELSQASSVQQEQGDGPLPADVSAASVMKQLGAAGLVTHTDGYVPVHGNPKGAVLLRLRNGKSALLVPHMESEAFLRHNARRADMIIMVGRDNKAVVVTTLEQLVVETIGGLG